MRSLFAFLVVSVCFANHGTALMYPTGLIPSCSIPLGMPYETNADNIRSLLVKALGSEKHERIELAMKVLFQDDFKCIAKENGQTVHIDNSQVTVNYMNQSPKTPAPERPTQTKDGSFQAQLFSAPDSRSDDGIFAAGFIPNMHSMFSMPIELVEHHQISEPTSTEPNHATKTSPVSLDFTQSSSPQNDSSQIINVQVINPQHDVASNSTQITKPQNVSTPASV
ncbi:hypothetical protein DSO57_1006116 [Entomophthora muscae]|uniref:Uncharacterized protein n=1 Tax=Entomophthora muscae TaxID=34485 RepID=A0ACC2TJ09_9FUNG|nr:hypothetical protein DSO57_1006116 [Entomophthora muscae]